ncbi:20064_t:CDS:1, partial [Funneliformis geosporum]
MDKLSSFCLPLAEVEEKAVNILKTHPNMSSGKINKENLSEG